MKNKNQNYNSKGNFFEEICSLKNIKDAYLDIREKFYNPVSEQYALGQLARGIDGVNFSIFDKGRKRRLKEIRKELIEFKKPLPSIDLKIPKASNPNKFRTISLSSLKEKIKHHAICRVMEPVLEELYADNLYSYRRGMGAYQAIKDFRKEILFSEKEYFVYKLDMKNYFDHLDHEITLELLMQHFCDEKLCELVEIFLKQERIVGNSISENEKGVIQGISISAHLANLYLLELDLKMKEEGWKYFRVGDDIIVLHNNLEELEEVAKFIEDFLINERKLLINKEKTEILKPGEPFVYLGYEIEGKTIRIAPRNCQRMKNKIRNKLTKKLTERIDKSKVDCELLLEEIVKVIFPEKRLPDHVMWLRYFMLTNDLRQLRRIDDFIENRIRLVYFGKKQNKSYSELPLEKLRRKRYISLSSIYFNITQGRKSFTDYVIKFTDQKS